MSYDFKGKTAVISGGNGALGLAVAERFATDGAKVIVAARKFPTPKEGNYDYQILNALDETSVRDFFRQLGSFDILVNVIGGYAAGDPVSSLDMSVLENQLEVNLKSAFLLTRYALQSMENKGGKIVHVGSRAAVDKGENSFAYSVSKLGVVRLVEAVAAETADQNININCVLPSLIDTPDNRKAMPNAHYDKWPKPAQIASVIAFLASEEAVLVNGAAIPVYGRV